MALSKKAILFRAIGLILSVGAPAICVLAYFPLWRDRGPTATLSGISLFLLVICSIPILRAIKSALRSPSAPIIWFIVFIAFFSLSRIADDVTVIAFTGFISNLIGAIFFCLARKEERGRYNEK